MFPIKCALCKQELDRPGALLFAPPLHSFDDFTTDEVSKQHICAKCYDWMIDTINLNFNYSRERKSNVNK
jgi:hypothetical protein